MAGIADKGLKAADEAINLIEAKALLDERH
jgi:hypothetical protein